jgi:hypothetical protein
MVERAGAGITGFLSHRYPQEGVLSKLLSRPCLTSCKPQARCGVARKMATEDQESSF